MTPKEFKSITGKSCADIDRLYTLPEHYTQNAVRRGYCNIRKAEKGTGNTAHPLHTLWCQMLDRCYNKNNHAYKHYGEKNIKVCADWFYSFPKFIEDMGDRPTAKHSIDRIDVNKGYSKDNCRWANTIIQAANKGYTGEYRGVNKIGNKYRASFSVGNKTVVVGSYNTLEEAVEEHRSNFYEWFGIYP